MTQFDRQIELRILLSKPNREPGYRGSLDISNLRMAFNIVKTTSSLANTCQMRVWNIAQTNRKQLENIGDQIRVFAGYRLDGGTQLLFTGNTTNVSHMWAEPEWISTFSVQDGELEISNQIVSYSFAPGTSVRTAITNVAQQLNVPIAFFAITDDLSYSNGSYNSDRARTVLDVLTAKIGLNWSLQNGKLYFTLPNSSIPKVPVEINADTGMIGIPERYTDVRGRTYIRAPKTGYKVRCLLNPLLIPKDLVRIRSERADMNGLFLIDKVTHVGDNYGQQFESQLEVIAQ